MTSLLSTESTEGRDYSDTYDPDTDFDRHYTIATGRRIATWVRPGQSVLELGCGTGLMSAEVLAGSAPARWVGLDRSETFLDRARARELPGATFTTADLDDLAADGESFDHVLATNVLHELADPLDFLRRAAARLAPGGHVHISLQNPLSVHRVCAFELGMIDSLVEVSDRGRQWGTRGLWTADDLADLAHEAGLRVEAREGVMLKPLPNHLMEQLPAEVIEGFIAAARHYPDSCAMSYLVLAHG
jgi:2-polyprenyl-3-methyl-5-hydroxy-6-metoxy-1,4-benzoquinol methylase